MKNYIDQFYNEGLGFVFYVKPIKKLSKVIKNKNILLQTQATISKLLSLS